MPKFLTGLRTEIVLNIAVLMIAATALIGFVVLKVSEQSVLDQKIKSAYVVLNSIQSSLRYIESSLPSSSDRKNIQRLIDVFIENGDIEAILVVDKAMRVTAHSASSQVGKEIHDDDLLKAVMSRKVTTKVAGGSVSISSPLYLKNEAIGGVKVTLSSRDVNEVAAKSLRLIFFYIALNSIILIIFGSYLLSRTIVKPIDELVRVTQAVATGDLNQHVKVKRFNEIGNLAESLNSMTERLRDNRKALEDNIRTLKSARDEVIRAEKMATVGRLAAGIAHEIGNPLSAIIGYTNIIQKGVEKDDEADYLRRIENEIQRINRIVRGLLDYARPGEFGIEEIDVNSIVRNSLDLVSAQKGFEHIEISEKLEKICPAYADSHQLQQVLINLFLNAADAMPIRGTLTVNTRRRWEEEKEFVEISVADTGTGISEDEIKRIFDPFYTTKEPGKGTGLGLAICQRIIESFGGKIEVFSRAGTGSTFAVLLPIRKRNVDSP